MQRILTWAFPVVRLGCPGAVGKNFKTGRSRKRHWISIQAGDGGAGLDPADGSMALEGSRLPLFYLSPWPEAILENHHGGGLLVGLDRVAKLAVCVPVIYALHANVPCSKTNTWDHPKCPTLNSLFAIPSRKRPCRGKRDHHHKHHGAEIVQGNEFVGARFRWHRVYLKKSMESQNGLSKGKTLLRLQMCHQSPQKDNRDNSRVPNPSHAAGPNPKSQKPISFSPNPPQMTRES